MAEEVVLSSDKSTQPASHPASHQPTLKNWNILTSEVQILLQFKLKISQPIQIQPILQMKTTSNGRQPPMEGNLQLKTTSDGRRAPMEDDLKI